ncbi:hypothetical protein C0995_007114 [Termitomyces sp. Mi166|nr:hypothetical protein C0995_007114 [Termitomyces sp. Mi166\
MDLTLWTASKNCLKGEWIKVGMTWSPRADFGLTPTPPVDGSLLIVGNRAGSLVFLSEAHSDPPELSLTFDANEKISQPDKTSVTALSWTEVSHKRSILVYCKPGKLYLWRHSSSDLGWSGSRSYRLKTQKLSVGSSSLHPASGIQYINRQDILVLTLFDGSFHIVYNLSGEPTMTPPTDDNAVISEKLSQTVRSVFAQTENDVDSGDMNRITGLTSYDGSATFIWIQEASRPSDFSYKHDAKHNSTLLVSGLWNENENDALVNELQAVLNGAKINRTKLSILYPRILAILKPKSDDHSLLVNVPTWASMTPELRRIFRTSLVRHLFGWDVLFSLRMRLSMADFVWKYIRDEQKQVECGHVAQDLLNKISHRVLRTIIRHLTAVVDLLTPNDIPFVLRMVVQSLLPGSPEDLSIEGKRLQNISQAVVYSNSQDILVTNTFNELCPACKVEVPLQDITTAVCTNGHTWGMFGPSACFASR